MRRLHSLAAIVLCLLILFGQTAIAADDDIIIDVENGNLVTGIYNIPLAKSDRPISVGMEDGNVVLIVQSDTGGAIRLDLGRGRVALTTRANPYVRIEQTSSATGNVLGGLEGQDDGSGNCTICGNPLATGDHSRYRCGHYVCKVGPNHSGSICPTCGKPMCLSTDVDHTVCPQCGVGFCGHDDRVCSYRHNPAPTPFQTTDPAGGTLYFYLSPDGVFMMGNPTGEKPLVWSPSSIYLKTRNTKTPDPDATMSFDFTLAPDDDPFTIEYVPAPT